jgi:formylglycine-generating enzyme required for sulfatase activity
MPTYRTVFISYSHVYAALIEQFRQDLRNHGIQVTLWHDRPPYDAMQHENDADTSSLRVLRGGSWDGIQLYARAAYRVSYIRDIWNYYRGIRVARAGGLVR